MAAYPPQTYPAAGGTPAGGAAAFAAPAPAQFAAPPAPAAAPSSHTNTTTMDRVQPSFVSRVRHQLSRQGQRYLDMSVPHLALRWVAFAALLGAYTVRVYLLQGFFIITYGLGIYLLNLFIGFLSPAVDPAAERRGGGGILGGEDKGGGGDDEFRPFVRRLPEFKFWVSCCKSVAMATFMTFFSAFDVPVFWPILLVYFLVLFFLTMKRQVRHMMKHKYVPFSVGKKTYKGKGGKGGKGDKDGKPAGPTLVAPLGAS